MPENERIFHVACPACGKQVSVSTERISDYWWGLTDCADCGWTVKVEDHREDGAGALDAATRSQVATIKLQEVEGDAAQ